MRVDPSVHIGEQYGIYVIESVLDERDKYGKCMYGAKCQECGYVKNGTLDYFKRKNVQTCTHFNRLTQEQKDLWYDKNKKTCLCCGKDIPLGNKTFAEYKALKFCSQSCSAIAANQNTKRKMYYCKQCGKLLGYGHDQCGQKQLCNDCNLFNVDWCSITYGDVKGQRKYQVNSRIREIARRLYQKSGKPQKCMNCGYDKHYEVCHIKGISTHSDDTSISEINKLDNLIALCPNCHWEFDHGLLDLQTITQS